MKKLLIIIFSIPFLALAQHDTSFSVTGEIISINQKGINNLVNKYSSVLTNLGGIEGWRVQLKFTSKREDIISYQKKFTSLYPEIPSHITFDSPYYKLTIGNFRTKNEALKTKKLIEKKFPGAHPITMIIEPDLFKK